MIIYPAIDMRGGKVVRLREGDPQQQTIYGDDPIAVAQRWQEAGADWLHVINLDGALDGATANLPVIEQMVDLGIRIQFGGGLRSLADAGRMRNLGVARVILGTALVEDPDLAATAVEQLGPEHIVAALDARTGRVAHRGWQDLSDWSPIDLGKHFAANGIKYALYTDITRDGGLQGVNVEATARLVSETGLQVIASGGVASLHDLVQLRARHIPGAVIGQALYQGLFSLSDALKVGSGSTIDAQKEV